VSDYLDFKLFQPKGRLAAIVQGVWSTSVVPHSPNPIKRWLQSDACSGIIFNLNSAIQLNDTVSAMGSVLQPVSKQAQEITLPPNAAVVGVRFHPGISFALLGSIYQQATLINQDQDNHLALNILTNQLKKSQGHFARITLIYRWLENILGLINSLPTPLKTALIALESKLSPGELSDHIDLSQRQIERQFQKWLDMTPKYYQRIFRIKNALKELRHNPEIDLADLALCNGFSDQAHMTREFQHIAKISPRHYSHKIIADNHHKDY
jgi:AraC-like DNA-binding protein